MLHNELVFYILNQDNHTRFMLNSMLILKSVVMAFIYSERHNLPGNKVLKLLKSLTFDLEAFKAAEQQLPDATGKFVCGRVRITHDLSRSEYKLKGKMVK